MGLGVKDEKPAESHGLGESWWSSYILGRSSRLESVRRRQQSRKRHYQENLNVKPQGIRSTGKKNVNTLGKQDGTEEHKSGITHGSVLPVFSFPFLAGSRLGFLGGNACWKYDDPPRRLGLCGWGREIVHLLTSIPQVKSCAWRGAGT